MMVASSSSLRQTLFFRCTDATRYLPGGKCTVPPPDVLHFSIALLSAGVSLVVPSPAATKFFSSNVLSPNFGCGMLGGEKSARATEQNSRTPRVQIDFTSLPHFVFVDGDVARARVPRATSLFASAGSKYSGGETESKCTPIARIAGVA